jgi:hypothetical protein
MKKRPAEMRAFFLLASVCDAGVSRLAFPAVSTPVLVHWRFSIFYAVIVGNPLSLSRQPYGVVHDDIFRIARHNLGGEESPVGAGGERQDGYDGEN